MRIITFLKDISVRKISIKGETYLFIYNNIDVWYVVVMTWRRVYVGSLTLDYCPTVADNLYSRLKFIKNENLKVADMLKKKNLSSSS